MRSERFRASCAACSSPAVQFSFPEEQVKVKRSLRRGLPDRTVWFNCPIRSIMTGTTSEVFCGEQNV